MKALNINGKIIPLYHRYLYIEKYYEESYRTSHKLTENIYLSMTEKSFKSGIFKGISMAQKEKTNHPVEERANNLLASHRRKTNKEQKHEYLFNLFSNQKNGN